MTAYPRRKRAATIASPVLLYSSESTPTLTSILLVVQGVLLALHPLREMTASMPVSDGAATQLAFAPAIASLFAPASSTPQAASFYSQQEAYSKNGKLAYLTEPHFGYQSDKQADRTIDRKEEPHNGSFNTIERCPKEILSEICEWALFYTCAKMLAL
ncbi:hypothetical protein K437DRAFT_20505 [Tilletiaria anomala UBC 951]|uniref:Uncharacterized protein n=1 Tax=Tilletiaria anomala (strain ATCC 24038 / CBS 436.72 / UBC 951) TaxID=1037660 RepID=A0A066VER3_TILAU|nr:uncharacterized protein K437DRAFT_20505 [Tilletiaria anomala UBC 951]KDN38788.1 hypothetical protein K437DRAFT_20505 [Tilletiaria anomala UBC 951]